MYTPQTTVAREERHKRRNTYEMWIQPVDLNVLMRILNETCGVRFRSLEGGCIQSPETNLNDYVIDEVQRQTID
jgi:hypothetical protein